MFVLVDLMQLYKIVADILQQLFQMKSLCRVQERYSLFMERVNVLFSSWRGESTTRREGRVRDEEIIFSFFINAD